MPWFGDKEQKREIEVAKQDINLVFEEATECLQLSTITFAVLDTVLTPDAVQDRAIRNTTASDMKVVNHLFNQRANYEKKYSDARKQLSAKRAKECIDQMKGSPSLEALNDLVPIAVTENEGIRSLLERTGMNNTEVYFLKGRVLEAYKSIRQAFVRVAVATFQRERQKNPPHPDQSDPSREELRAELERRGLTKMEAYDAFPSGE